MAIDISETRSRPIGVFDSGMGGLSVLRELTRELPSEDFFYVADSAHCPYGVRPMEFIITRACVITDFLLSQGAKLIVVACNAATVAAVEYLRAHYQVSFVGMEPGVKPAVARTRTGVVGVLTTTLTASGERLHRLIRQHAGAAQVLTQGCPGWVECVEAGEVETAKTHALIEHYVLPLLAARADTLVLGCTHYPFLREPLQKVIGPEVVLVDTGEAVARRTASVLQQEGLRSPRDRPGYIHWYTTGRAEAFARVGAQLWGTPLHVRPLESDELPAGVARIQR